MTFESFLFVLIGLSAIFKNSFFESEFYAQVMIWGLLIWFVGSIVLSVVMVIYSGHYRLYQK